MGLKLSENIMKSSIFEPCAGGGDLKPITIVSWVEKDL